MFVSMRIVYLAEAGKFLVQGFVIVTYAMHVTLLKE